MHPKGGSIMLFRAKEKHLTLDGVRMDYITFGSGSRLLVMIQGLNTRGVRGSSVPLAFMYRLFAKAYTVYLFDRRADVFEGMTIRDLAHDLARAMDALGIKEADILGVSQGGMIAQVLAIERPDLVRRLALAVTLCRANDTVRNVINGWIAMVSRGDMKALVADMAEKMYSDAYLKRYRPLLPLLTILQRPKDVRRFVILASACLTCDTFDELEKIQCPVFVIGGRQDRVVGSGACEDIAKRLGCKVHLYETLGHAAYEEAGDFNRRVYDFFMEG